MSRESTAVSRESTAVSRESTAVSRESTAVSREETPVSSCIFCSIGSGKIPVNAVAEDDLCLAFPDAHPQAPIHLLVIPKQHYAHVEEAPPELLGHLLHIAAKLGQSRSPGGHRVVINTGADGGQTVLHLHLHLLGGRHLGWPPG